MPNRLMEFASPDLAAQLLKSAPAELDALPFGVVRMDTKGVVEFYNTFESRLSGMSPETVLGKHFFTEIAPCTNNFMVAERFASEPLLDATIDYVFTYRMAPTKVRLRLLRDEAAGWQFLCVELPA